MFLKTLTRIREYLPHTLYPLPAVVPGAWHQDDAEGLCQAAVQKGPETDHLEKSCSPLPGTVDLLVDRIRVVAGFNHTPSYQARGGEAVEAVLDSVEMFSWGFSTALLVT